MMGGRVWGSESSGGGPVSLDSADLTWQDPASRVEAKALVPKKKW